VQGTFFTRDQIFLKKNCTLKSENKKFFLQKIKEKEKYPFFLEIIAASIP
jgi:hypothetical protein